MQHQKRLIVSFLICLAGAAQNSTTRLDPSVHQIRMITVEPNVQLEVLDWSGRGRPLVMLAGSGNSAHVFDGFAEKLTNRNHVYGITRRGYGSSSRPPSGYDSARLASDVLVVIDSLRLGRPILLGHSLGGKELTALATEHPKRISGLIYIDSTADPTYDWTANTERRKRLPPPAVPRPTKQDLASVQAYRDWQVRAWGYAMPPGDISNVFGINADGSVAPQKTPPWVGDAIFRGTKKPDYSGIRVPVLAFFAPPAPPEQQAKTFQPLNEEQRAILQSLYEEELAFSRNASSTLKKGVPDARIVEIQGAAHYMFLSNESEVLREIRLFANQIR
jgi:pimeloyl-ACP methyl ester carboxylesterase